MLSYLQSILWPETHCLKTTIDDSLRILKWLVDSGSKHTGSLGPIKSDPAGTLAQ